jgi:hypothetical protein
VLSKNLRLQTSVRTRQFRQLGDVGGDTPRLVTGEQLARRPATGLILAIDEGQCLPVGVADDEARGGFLDGPRWRKAAGQRHWFGSASAQRTQQIDAHAAIELHRAGATARAER